MTASDDDDELSARTGKQARGKKSKYPPNITVSMIDHANKNKGNNGVRHSIAGDTASGKVCVLSFLTRETTRYPQLKATSR